MYHSSIFLQLLKNLPRHLFQSIVEHHQADRYRKSFKTKDVSVLIRTSFISQPTLKPPKTVPKLTKQLSLVFS
ncbi:MAG: DUF4372 domain-containing protein [Alphaproteobacteria bacterium]|nr:DUF4372 domain-containing protein [Alphaproteobacteria bacterium]OJV47811.1 MAG: hypothetical protein BGO28_05760 [Alphaproteobacteria bacterium 43-37]